MSWGKTLLLAGVAVGAGTLLAGAAAAGVTAAGVSAWRRRRGWPLRGRVVLISGARGLGFAIAREMLRHGARVALCARDPEELQRAAEKLSRLGEVFTVAADLTRPEAPGEVVAAVTAHWGPVEILVHNAGIMQVGPADQFDEADYRAAMEIHFWAAYRLARAVLPGMIARRQGRIVNVASIGGLVAVPHMLPYTASKFALVGFSQGLHAEVARHGVRVTCVCPWMTRTGSQEGVTVKGDHAREFGWFAASGALPGLTQSASAAARRIVAATRAGRPMLVLSLGRVVAKAHGLAPGVVTRAMSVAERFLPQSAPGTEARSGAESYNATTRRLIQPLVRRAGAGLNQPQPADFIAD